MTFKSWLQGLKKQFNGASRNRKRPLARCRPSLEALEVRLTPALAQPTYLIFQPANGGPAQSPGPVGLAPDQIRTAYGINKIAFGGTTGDGTGQTIAIVDAFNDPNALTDLDGFDSAMHPTASGPTLAQQYGPASSFLTVYNQKGTNITSTIGTSGSNGVPPVDPTGRWEGEEALDIEWAHAIAPGARIDLIEVNGSLNDLFAGAKTAAGLPGVSVVSMSFTAADPNGTPVEFSGENVFDSNFTTPYGHQGVTFLGSTGDLGSPGGYPAYSPNVVAVGGTTLALNPLDNSITSETGWSRGSDTFNPVGASGGGTSQFEPEPPYQQNAQSTGNRTIPDVAFDADPNSGVAIYDSYNNGSTNPWEQIGGTSLSAPCWAGLIAIVNQGRALAGSATLNSSLNPTQTMSALYNLPAADFHDITNGSNGDFSAGPGYDEVTGLGTPVANLLVADLVAYQPGELLTVNTLADSSGQVGQTSLLDAVNAANLDAQRSFTDTIDFAPSLAGGTITLGSAPFRQLQSIEVRGSVTIDASGLAGGITISGNKVTQVFVVDGSANNVVFNGLTLTDGRFSTTSGGAIQNDGTLTLEICTITSSSGVTGGGIYNDHNLTVIDSTISDNEAGEGGGIANDGTLVMINSTISGNVAGEGGGIANFSTVTLDNTIVAGNHGTVAVDLWNNGNQVGTSVTGSDNLIGIGDGITGLTNGSNGNQVGTSANPIDPQLGTLDNYGGPTQTMALLPGSPAIGKGSSSVAVDGQGNPLTTDQRGQPRGGNNPVDIGAFQSQGPSLVVTTTADPGGLVGLLSLREALNLAQVEAATGAPATITFAAELGDSTITLAGSELELKAAAGLVTVDGGNQITISGNDQSSVFQVDAGAQAILNGLTIEKGNSGFGGAVPAVGGGVDNTGTLTLLNCTVSDNFSSFGAGIANSGTLSICGSTVADNNNPAAVGAGIDNTGTLTLSNSTLTGNQGELGGAIANTGKLTLTNCTLSGNGAFDGGGIYNYSFGTLALQNTIVAGNSFGGTAGLGGPDISDIAHENPALYFTDLGHNLLGTALQTANSPATDQFSDTPGLTSLGNYGGPTQTLALLPGSPALHAGGAVTSLSQDFSFTQTLEVANGASFAATSLPTLASGSYFRIQVGESIYAVSGLVLNPDGSATLTISQVGGPEGSYGAGIPVFLVSDEPGLSVPYNSTPVVDIGAFEGQSGLVVTTEADPGGISGQLSLREAINLANAYARAGNASTITFAANLPPVGNQQFFNVITLSQGPLELSGSAAAGTATITIDATSFQLGQLEIIGDLQSSVFVIDSGVTAVLNNLSIGNGYAAIGGGGILNSLGGTLTVVNSTIAGCSASSFGGGIANLGTLTVTGSTISGNTTPQGGGGIENQGGMTVTNSTIAGNTASRGGGIDNDLGTVMVTNSTIVGNTAASGGGISNLATVAMSDCIVAANTGGPAPDVNNQGGSVTASNCMIGDPSGNGITAANGNIVKPTVLGIGGQFLDCGGPTETLPLQPGSEAVGAGGAVTILQAPINDTISTTVAVVNAATIASTPGSYLIWIDTEQMLVTNVNLAANTLSVVRGYNGTTAATHTNASAVYLATDQRGFWRPTSAPDMGAYQLSTNRETRQVIVNTAADTTGVPGTTSLRDALATANSDAPHGISDTITFDTTQMGTNTVTLSAPGFLVNPGTGTTTIDGGGRIAISGNNNDRILQLLPGALAVVTGLTIQNGGGSLDGFGGGAILTSGVLNVKDSTFTHNNTSAVGGAIATAQGGILTLSNVTLADNSSSHGGGGIANEGGIVTVTNGSTLSHNSSPGGGGGVANLSGTLMLSDSTLANNSAGTGPGIGGGILNKDQLTVNNCAITGNSALNGAGIANLGILTVSNCTLASNSVAAGHSGGGIYNRDGLLTLTNDTLSGNSASNGAAILAFSGTLTLTDDTLSGNSTTNGGNGGGISMVSGTLTLTNDTLTGNSAFLGGGIAITSGSVVTLVNTIVAGNTGTAPDIFGTVSAGSTHNLIGDGTDMSGIEDSATFGDPLGNQVGGGGNGSGTLLDPMLAPLNDYGGPTQTRALLPGSPALGTGGAVTSTVADDLTIPGNPTSSTTTALLSVANAAVIASTPGTYTIQVQDGKLGSVQLVVAGVDATAKPNTLSVVVPAGFSGATFSANDPIFLAGDQRGQGRPAAAPDIGAYQTQPGNLTGSIVVTTPADPGQLSGQLSLREAVNLAVAEAAAAPGQSETITLPPGLGTITLTAPIPLTGTITINGQGTISGNQVTKLFQITPGANVTLGSAVAVGPGLKLEAADPTFGAISNAGTLTVLGCTFQGNVATVAGGAVYNTGTLIVTRSTFLGNSAGARGGAIDNAGGTVSVTGCTFSGNTAGLTGGAIDNEAGMLTVAHSTVAANSAPAGGGIWNQGTLTLIDSNISGNAGPGSGGGPLVIDDSADTGNATYTITASTVQVNELPLLTYTGAQSLTIEGGSGPDTFDVQGTAAATPVTLNTGAGSNTVTAAGQTQSLDAIQGALTVNVGTGPATLVVDDQATTGARTWMLTQGNLTATAAAGTNGVGAHVAFTKLAGVTVNGGSGGNTFNVQGTDADTAFTLNTGAGNGAVNVGDGRNTLEEFLGTLTVNGQAGGDTLNLNDQGELDPATQGQYSPYHTENDTWSPAANGLPARVDFSHLPAGVLAQPGFTNFVTTSLYWQNFQQIVFTDPVGGSTVVHDFLPNALAGTHLTLHGGVLNDTLFSGAAAGQHQTFTVTGPNAGTVGNISYTGVVYLLSFGAGQSKFKFLPGGSEVALNGDGSPAALDLSALTTPATVNLPYFSASGYNWGSVPGVVRTFASMTSVVGASGDTLVGGNAANTWSVTGQNAGQVTGVTFSGFSNLTGGSQADTFAFVNGGSVTGAVNGGGGTNALDYSAYGGDIVVDLALGTATGVGGGVAGIANLTGSVGNDVLVGDANANVLVGGTGRNLIIGGGGPDQLFGGNLDNILIAGYTLFDQDPNLIGLRAIMKEWISGNTFATRVKNISNGVIGSDGKSYALIGGNGKGRTVFDDRALDVLTCTPNADPGVLDWLFANMATDQIVNPKKKDFTYEVPLF
jgi:hypothetical protein